MALGSVPAPQKRCVTCKRVRAGACFFRHRYVTSAGTKSTRYESNCKDCKRAKARATRDANIDAHAARSKAYRQRHRERIAAEGREYYRRHADALKRSQFKYHLWENYGLTVEAYERLVAEQGNRCKVCGDPEGHPRKRRLHVDHNHDTGQVRGLLCHHCNCALGHLRDDPRRVNALLDYIRSFAP